MKKLAALVILCCVFVCAHGQKRNATPNIVLIFLDDMGYGDLGVTGALQYQTPHIDKLAHEGMRFTNFETAQAVCSASRAGLLTGCYPNRIGISGALRPFDSIGLNRSETTIAEMLKQKGYTTAVIGKWHLGHLKPFLPLQHGFDEYFGLPYSNDMWPFDYVGNPAQPGNRKANFPALPLIRGNDKVAEINTLDDQARLTKMYTDEAVSFIKKNAKKPFFLYLPHSMPHVPIAASATFKGKSKQGTYGDVMMEIDWSVGEIMKTLETEGLDNNTVVIFTSDNGPWLIFGDHAGSSGGFREGKGTIFEGGHRVPCIVRWKGKVKGGSVCNTLASTIDILPTVAAITGSKLPDLKIDGVSLLPVLEGQNVSPRKYFSYYYDGNSLKAVRMDDWKLMLPHTSQTYENIKIGNGGMSGAARSDLNVTLALYDLRRDPGERYDVKELYPQITEALLKQADEVREDLGDNITKNQGKNRRPVGRL
jgi:arylsulfatase A-like enzyme